MSVIPTLLGHADVDLAPMKLYQLCCMIQQVQSKSTQPSLFRSCHAQCPRNNTMLGTEE